MYEYHKVTLSDGKFWVYIEDYVKGDYEEELNRYSFPWVKYYWTLEYKTDKQRKYRQSALSCKDLFSISENIKEILKDNDEVLASNHEMNMKVIFRKG